MTLFRMSKHCYVDSKIFALTSFPAKHLIAAAAAADPPVIPLDTAVGGEGRVVLLSGSNDRFRWPTSPPLGLRELASATGGSSNMSKLLSLIEH